MYIMFFIKLNKFYSWVELEWTTYVIKIRDFMSLFPTFLGRGFQEHLT